MTTLRRTTQRGKRHVPHATSEGQRPLTPGLCVFAAKAYIGVSKNGPGLAVYV